MATPPCNRVLVGMGLFVVRNSADGSVEILLGKRKGAHGAGEWALPGGKPELWENPETGLIRETKEETNLDVFLLDKLTWEEDRYPSDLLHFVTLFYYTWHFNGEVKVMEPDKCEEWRWFPLSNLPATMMAGCRRAADLLLSKINAVYLRMNDTCKEVKKHISEWCAADPMICSFHFIGDADNKVSCVLVPIHEQYDFDLGDRIASLNLELGKIYPDISIDIIQAPSVVTETMMQEGHIREP